MCYNSYVNINRVPTLPNKSLTPTASFNMSGLIFDMMVHCRFIDRWDVDSTDMINIVWYTAVYERLPTVCETFCFNDLTDEFKDRPTRRQGTMTCNAHNSVNHGSI